MTLIEKIDARFRSGNSVPITRAHITDVEWAALKRLTESIRAERKLHADFEYSIGKGFTPSIADHETRVMHAEATTNAALHAITE